MKPLINPGTHTLQISNKPYVSQKANVVYDLYQTTLLRLSLQVGIIQTHPDSSYQQG